MTSRRRSLRGAVVPAAPGVDDVANAPTRVTRSRSAARPSLSLPPSVSTVSEKEDRQHTTTTARTQEPSPLSLSSPSPAAKPVAGGVEPHITTATTLNSHTAATDNTHPPLQFPFGVCLLSLLGYPVCYLLSLSSTMNDDVLVFIAGIVFCLSLIPLTYYLVVRYVRGESDMFIYVFVVFAFTAVVDACFVGTIAGYTQHSHFYLTSGEVYLTTAHGLAINFWDATVHWICMIILSAYLLRDSKTAYMSPTFRTVGLMWCGSILNSLLVLLVGSAVGIHAVNIKPSYLLNIPYAILPAVFLYRLLTRRPPASTMQLAVGRDNQLLWWFELPLLTLIFAGVSLCVVRALAVLTTRLPIAAWYAQSVETHLLDPTAYPQIQMLTYAFYYIPFLVAALVRIVRGGSSSSDAAATASLKDWSLFFAGALFQGTFSYVGASLMQGAGMYAYSEWLPQDLTHLPTVVWFIFANTLLLSLPFFIRARLRSASTLLTYIGIGVAIVETQDSRLYYSGFSGVRLTATLPTR